MSTPNYQPRGPWDDDEPDGLLESDNDYVSNNLELAVHLLDEHFAAQNRIANEIIGEILQNVTHWRSLPSTPRKR
jgi:hypothetical protein